MKLFHPSLSLLIFSISLMGQPAFAGDATQDECSIELKKLSQGLELTEAATSNGQIQNCVPTTAPDSRVSKIKQNVDSAKSVFDSEYQKYLDGSTKGVAGVNEALKNNGGNICGLTPETRAQVEKLDDTIYNADLHLNSDVRIAVSKSSDLFGKTYGSPGALSQLQTKIIQRKKNNCAQTKANIAAIRAQFKKALTACEMSIGGRAPGGTTSGVAALHKYLSYSILNTAGCQ